MVKVMVQAQYGDVVAEAMFMDAETIAPDMNHLLETAHTVNRAINGLWVRAYNVEGRIIAGAQLVEDHTDQVFGTDEFAMNLATLMEEM